MAPPPSVQYVNMLDRPTAVWKLMTEAERLEASLAFWADEESAPLHAEAVHLIAGRMKFRARSVLELSLDRKARYLASLARSFDSIAGRALVAFHLTARRSMMAAFLDALGVVHENGLITADPLVLPAADRVKQAVFDLASAYPPREVALYLSTLATQDPDTWGQVADLGPARLDPRA